MSFCIGAVFTKKWSYILVRNAYISQDVIYLQQVKSGH